jgi:caffeoyl-CoA O-methyltransferase
VSSISFTKVQNYLVRLVPPRDPELVRMERYAARTGFPIIGPAAGNFCYQVARLIRAKSIFELGSGYGYSTAWFALAVRENGGGLVHHCVWDARLSEKARRHLAHLGLDSLTAFHVAEAVETLRNQTGTFDLIFNDIQKQDYAASLPVIKQKLRTGGVLIADNMLWSGRIFDRADRSAATQGVRQFARAITADHDWIVTLVPIRDGMMIGYLK